jgi:RNA polymerase sigma factor (sigma-70 family)
MSQDEAHQGAAPSREDERTYLETVLRGDRAARAGFVDRFARLVHAVIERTLRRHHGSARHKRSDDLVEDLFAEVLVALFERDGRRLRQWSGRCSLATWVRLVSASVTIDRLRKDATVRATPAPASALEALASGEPGAAALIERAEELASVVAALDALSASDRQLLIWLVVEERPADAVAGELGIALGALYTRKNRAIQRLRGEFERRRRHEL